MNYQEWQHSDYAKKEQRSCQSCHMPAVAGPIRIASVLGDQRDSLARHTFVGGNAHMLRLLNRFRDELGVTAPAAEMEATARATVRQLQQDTATIRVSRAAGGRRPARVRRPGHQPHRAQIPDRISIAAHLAARHRA